MSAKVELTAELVRELLDYDPETGVLRWKQRPREGFPSVGAWVSWNKRCANAQAGCLDCIGYVKMRLLGRTQRAHRVIWLWMTGEWPDLDIDHRDCDPSNNRWSNLRLATRTQNHANRSMQRNNSSGYKGVSFHKESSRWRAVITVQRRHIELGKFDDIEDARAAYLKAAADFFGEFARAA